jgi:hypothetical protein
MAKAKKDIATPSSANIPPDKGLKLGKPRGHSSPVAKVVPSRVETGRDEMEGAEMERPVTQSDVLCRAETVVETCRDDSDQSVSDESTTYTKTYDVDDLRTLYGSCRESKMAVEANKVDKKGQLKPMGEKLKGVSILISDDADRLPLKLSAEAIIGSVSATLAGFEAR